ncbi:hypothetical protein PENTCL1PPCAC_23417, partial [Pristionchus entomophagus]
SPLPSSYKIQPIISSDMPSSDNMAIPSRTVNVIDYKTGKERIRDFNEILDHFVKEDQKSASRGDRFSRVCGACGTEQPRRRVVSDKCGHAFCRECADGKNTCPDCEKPCSFIHLYEDDDHSRQCGVCLNEAPRYRSFFKDCGHLVCRVCAIRSAPESGQSTVSCPFCRVPSKSAVPLIEKI